MATTLQELLNANNPIRADSGTDLDSMASGGVVLCTPVLSNVQGDAAGLGYPVIKAKLSLSSAAFGANAAIYGWLLCADDATNYEYYKSGTSTTTAPVARAPDFTWPLYNVNAAQIIDAYAVRGAPICAHMKMLVWAMGGVTLGTGNTINLYYQTDQGN